MDKCITMGTISAGSGHGVNLLGRRDKRNLVPQYIYLGFLNRREALGRPGEAMGKLREGSKNQEDCALPQSPSDWIHLVLWNEIFLWKRNPWQKWRTPSEKDQNEIFGMTDGLPVYFLSDHYENRSTSYVLCGPKTPPKQLNDWHPSFLFFVVNKHAYHGANRTALPPGYMWNNFEWFSVGLAESWFGIDQMEIKWSPLNCLLLELLCLCCPISQNPPSVSSPFPKTLHISWLLP